MGKTKQQLIVDNNTSFPNNNVNYITPSLLRDFNRDMIDNTVNQDVYTADSGSFNGRVTALENTSVTSAITASSLITASFASQVITFTKGDGTTFGITIPDVSGSILPDGTISGSTQISNLGFINATQTASMAVSSSLYAVTASLAREVIVSAINANQSTLPIGTVVRISGANGDNPQFNTASFLDETNSSNTLGILANTAVSGQYGDVTVIGKLVGVNTAGMNAGDLIYLSSSGQFTNVQPQAPLQIVTLGEVLRVQQNNGSIFVNVSNGWELNELHNVRITSAQQGDILVYEASSSLWKNVPSSSIAGTPTSTGSLLVTASFDGNSTIAFTKGDGSQFSLSGLANTGSNTFTGINTFTVGQTSFFSPVLFGAGSNTTVVSGSSFTFGLSGTTGSNYTLKSNPFESVLLITRESDNAKPIQMDWRDNKVTLAESGAVDISPSAFGGFKVNTTASFYGNAVWLIAEGFTSSLAYITASASGSDSNLIFKNGSTTTATVVSGSSNIFQSPAAPTAGFVRNIGGSSNILLTSGSVPQISGSMLTIPSLYGNIFSHTSTNNITLRGPVSSSAYSINGNILMNGQLNFGASAANSFDKATAGMTATGNALFNGTIGVNAPTTPLSSSVQIAGNLVFGASVTLNCFSSSITYASNVQNGGITVNNSFAALSGSNAAVLSVRSNVNTIYGIGHTLNVSGTNTSTTQGKQFFANILAGTFISSSIGTGDNCNILATGVIGNSLIITGSTLTSTFAGPDTANSGQGSLFAGRFNSVDGTKDQTGETVFAVGTGTSNSNRKTGFLIDSGSNTFVEGTLNVSGSSSFTGSVSISTTMKLGASDPLPTGEIGMLAVSASHLWFYNGAWTQLD